MKKPSLHLYCITNIVNGKKYIGITNQGAERRFSQHLNDAKRYDTALHRAIRKYGRNSFSTEVLGVASSYDQLLQMEKDAILSFKTAVPNGYNMTHGGDENWRLVSEESIKNRNCKISNSLKGIERSKEFGEKVSLAKKNNPISKEGIDSIKKSRSRPVICKQTGYVFESGKAACEWLRSKGFDKAGPAVIAACCRGRSKSAYGYNWEYADGSSPEFVPKTNKTRSVKSPDLRGIVFSSVTEAVNYLVSKGVERAATSAVSKAANGKIKHAYGYRWEYVWD